MIYKDKKITVMGLGIYPKGSGVSAVHFLCSQGAKVTVTDLRTKEELASQIKQLNKYKNIRYVLGKHDMKDFKNVDIIVKNPGVPMGSPFLKEAQKNKIPIHSDITLFLQEVDNPIIGITGTRGKSTTATLAHLLLQQKYPRARLGGNISISPLQFLTSLKDEDPVVLELSSWMLHNLPTIKKSPHMAVLTNVMVDHLNTYSSFAAYAKDKELIFKYQHSHDVAILNKDNVHSKDAAKRVSSQVYWYSIKPLTKKESGVYVDSKGMICFQEDDVVTKILHISKMAMQAPHMISNALAAIVIAVLSGVEPKAMKKVLTSFKGVPSRMEVIRTVKGVTYVNDTTSTMPDATLAALQAYKDSDVVLLAGGADKELDYLSLATYINKHRIPLILFTGSATDKLLPLINLDAVAVTLVASMKDAVRYAQYHIGKKGVVLLSPGAASFGLFKNEFDRGDQFVSLVRSLS